MDRFESEGGEQSYDYTMKQVLVNLKAKPSIRAKNYWDLTDKVCREGTRIIERIVENGEVSKNDSERLKPEDCHAPRLSGLPKIHKDGVPLKGVVSTVGSPFEKLSRFVIPILRTIQGRSRLYLKNSRELKEKVKNWRVERNEILVSVSPSSTKDEEGCSVDSIDRKVAARERQQDAVEDDIMEDDLYTPSQVEDLDDNEPLTNDIKIPFLYKKNPESLNFGQDTDLTPDCL
ncbi:Hypothetical predicted protein, partial [Paramuricea clavata]